MTATFDWEETAKQEGPLPDNCYDGDLAAIIDSATGGRVRGTLWERLGSTRGPRPSRWIACVGVRIQSGVGSIIDGGGTVFGVAFDRPSSDGRVWVPGRITLT